MDIHIHGKPGEISLNFFLSDKFSFKNTKVEARNFGVGTWGAKMKLLEPIIFLV